MNKHEMREEAVERLRDVAKHQPFGPLCADDITQALVGDEWVCSTVDEDAKTIIDLLTDDESYEDDAYTMGPRDADGILWFRGDMSDSPWGAIEGIFYDCTRREWLVRGHDISAPWVPADSIRHAPMRTATQRENDLIKLLKDAAKDYQRERLEVEWQKGLYKGLSDRVVSDMMLLPRDANGDVIHVGDEMVVGDYRYIVDGVGLAGNTDVFFVTDGDKINGFPAKVCRHYHKPTVDEILDELEGMRGTGDYDDVVERCADLAGMLRELLEEGEDED